MTEYPALYAAFGFKPAGESGGASQKLRRLASEPSGDVLIVAIQASLYHGFNFERRSRMAARDINL
ncbi:MAG TPA: hypothetical protein VEK34_15120 [Methylocella sp.]|nr:hypothetical protein [Methylocella sp.]